jgi:hypothetical protein
MKAFVADFARYARLFRMREAFDIACTLRRTRIVLKRAGYHSK